MNLISFIPIAGFVTALIAFLLLLITLRNLQSKKGSLSGSITNILLFLIFGLLSVVFILTFMSFKNYQNFSYQEPVLSIVCSLKNEDWFIIELSDLNNNNEDKRFFRIKGQQFLIEGHIVKWDTFFAYMGMKPLYQITRLTGRYIDIEDEKNRERSIFELNRTSDFWNFLMNNRNWIPGIDAVYGTASFTYPREDDTLRLFITHSGFMLK